MTYEIIQAGSIEKLTEQVNEKIKSGSVPVGGIAVEVTEEYLTLEIRGNRVIYFQAMITETRVINVGVEP